MRNIFELSANKKTSILTTSNRSIASFALIISVIDVFRKKSSVCRQEALVSI